MDHRVIEFILHITNEALYITLLVCGPSIGLSMLVGLTVSLFQAVTQIQEQTLTFVPKMVIIFASLAALGPWLGLTLLTFCQRCFEGFPKILF